MMQLAIYCGRRSYVGRTATRPLLIATLASIAFPATAQAHDFWLTPVAAADESQQYRTIAFRVGHGGEDEPWALAPDRLASFRLHAGDGSRDILRDVIATIDGPAGQAQLPVDSGGPSLVSMVSAPAISRLPGDKFRAYAEEEGLRRVLDALETEIADNRIERYRRCAKLILPGDRSATAPTALTAPVGLPLEIIPKTSPYGGTTGDGFTVAIRYAGAPLNGAKVHLSSVTTPAVGEKAALTDENGEARFDLTPSGVWRFNAVWSERVLDDPEADFETYFASLTVAFP